MKKNQTYKNLNYDFSDYAEEITGNALFEINGGAEVENSHEGVAGANVGDTITRKNGEVIVLKQADIDYAQQQLGDAGNASGSSKSGNNNQGTSGTSSTSNNNNSDLNEDSAPAYSQSNYDSYAYYMSMQGRAKDEGNPDKYKGYNVRGVQIKELQNTKTEIEVNQLCVKEKIDWLKEIDDIFDLEFVPYAGISLSLNEFIETSLKFNLFSRSNNNPYIWSSSLEATLQLGSSNAPLLEYGGKWEKLAGGETPLSLLEYGYEYEFTPITELNTKGKYNFEIDGLFIQASFFTDEYFDLVNKISNTIYDTIKNRGEK